MTFDEVFAANKGYWDSQYAMIHQHQQIRCIAIGSPVKYDLTPFGSSLLAYESASEVKSTERKKRGRKVEVDEVPEPELDPVVDAEPELDLDELDI